MVEERKRIKRATGYRPEWYRVREGRHVVAKDMRRISASFDAADFKELADIARDSKRPTASVIREAVRFYLDAMGQS